VRQLREQVNVTLTRVSISARSGKNPLAVQPRIAVDFTTDSINGATGERGRDTGDDERRRAGRVVAQAA
jgi:hypothetical protein